MKVFGVIPEFRILRLTFHRKSASKSWIRRIIIGFLIYITVCLKTIGRLKFKLWIFASFKIWVSKVQDFGNFELSPMLYPLLSLVQTRKCPDMTEKCWLGCKSNTVHHLVPFLWSLRFFPLKKSRPILFDRSWSFRLFWCRKPHLVTELQWMTSKFILEGYMILKLTTNQKWVNPYKPSILFVGHRQTVQTQISRRITLCLIRVFTVCLQNILCTFELIWKIPPSTPKIRNRLALSMWIGKFIGL